MTSLSSFKTLFCAFSLSLLLVGCGGGSTTVQEDLIEKHLNEVIAAKTPFALSKSETPVLNTHDWDLIFGGPDGNTLKYDRYGEVDEVVFVALPNTFFSVQRQIRKVTRSGAETIYYKVTTPIYNGPQPLWIDGRFLDLHDSRPAEKPEASTAAKTLIKLRRYEGLPYTWHGASETGIAALLNYYPPEDRLTLRSRDDWTLKGFDSLGMLYHASGGQTPLDIDDLARFGEPFYVDLDQVEAEEDEDEAQQLVRQANFLMARLNPLDILSMGDRMWVVLDKGQVVESRYRSKFDGGVRISNLFDTVQGLLQKAVFVKNPFEELDDPLAKRFYVRRYANTSSLLQEQLEEIAASDEEEPDDSETDETLPEEDEGEGEEEGEL